MHHLSIDLETYSGVPIGRAGLHNYISSPDFEILLFAYSLDGSEPVCCDIAQGETLPNWVTEALFDPVCIKHAYNAPFEIGCLSKYMGGQLPVNQWRCTMVHGMYAGYPAGLDAIGRAMGLPEDKRKLSSGKALIRYFCTPCAPTKSNGGRTRNMPHHDPARWELFKKYCVGDVVTEMDIARRLSGIPVPDSVQKQWETDFAINNRGVAVDMELVNGALALDTAVREDLIAEARQLTELNNPNSVQQLSAWLTKETGEQVETLRKGDVSKMLARGDISPEVRRMLEIRQELGKTSTKKYNAIEQAVCSDGRVRGLLQFYGANRTGRWAGRSVQIHNLPRTYTEPLDLARSLVKGRKPDAVRCVYGSVPDTLSQLIRTAFAASPGNVLIDADFSAIEARVVAWLAQEEWVLEVFRTTGKIYEAAASQLYGVPIDLIKKGNPEYALRQYGKAATLALGYQGGPAALITAGNLPETTPIEQLEDIKTRWRASNKRIVDLWYKLQNAAVQVVSQGGCAGVNGLVIAHEFDAAQNTSCLTIALPSGRKLYYSAPQIGVNQWGGQSISYMGVDQQSKKWGRIETYGGKLTENVVQALARDCLAEAIERLEATGMRVAFHVHDEVVIEAPAHLNSADVLKKVTDIMSEPIPWAPGLPLGADGWVGEYFKKE